jgi:hypothetical protein
MGIGLRGGDEACADADTVSTGRERCRHAAGRADTAGGDDGNPDRVAHRAQEWEKRHPPPDVSACLRALHDDEVTSRALGGDRLLDRPDLPARERTAGVHRFDKRGVRLGIEELHHAGSRRCDVDGVAVEEGHEEGHPERSPGPGRHAFEHLRKDWRRNHRGPEHPKATRIRDREHERGSRDAAHTGLLERRLAADQAREPRR